MPVPSQLHFLLMIIGFVIGCWWSIDDNDNWNGYFKRIGCMLAGLLVFFLIENLFKSKIMISPGFLFFTLFGYGAGLILAKKQKTLMGFIKLQACGGCGMLLYTYLDFLKYFKFTDRITLPVFFNIPLSSIFS